MAQRSIEVKVGMLILAAVGLLAAFIVVLGGINFEPTYTVYVAFDNPGGLQAGAPVRLASIKIGQVKALEFRGDARDPATGRALPPIQAVAEIEEQYQAAIHQDSRWYVTTQGVLGEMFLAVEPGSPQLPPLQDGARVQGVSPPRLDLLLAESYELLHRAYVGITNNDAKIAAMFDDLSQTLRGTSRFFVHNQDKLDNIVGNLEALTLDARETVKLARQQYVDNPRIDRILRNVERSTSELDQNLGPLLSDGRSVLVDTKRLSQALASEEQLRRYAELTANLVETSADAKRAADDARLLTERLRRGEGTVGALMTDEAVYDDLQELLRDLKRNPWKLFWKD